MTRKILATMISVALILGSFMFVPAPAMAAVSLTLSTAIGQAGASVTAFGASSIAAGFNAAGYVWFDSVTVNAAYDAGEPFFPFVTGPTGAYSVTFAVPSILPRIATYNVHAFVTGDGVSPAVTFTVSLASPRASGPGTVVSIAGGGFAASSAGVAYFDSNGGGTYTTGEPIAIFTTTATGLIPAGITLTVPNVAAGNYDIFVDIDFDGTNEARSVYTVSPKAIALSTATGIPGSTVSVTVAGTAGLWASTLHRAYFDSNGNSSWDAGEPFTDFTSTATGGISAAVALTVPEVVGGAYNVRVDISPFTTPAEASAPYTVINAIVLTPISGLVGSTVTIRGGGFAANQPGLVWFDRDTVGNTDGVLDADEPRVSVLSSAAGTFVTTLTVPTVTGALPNVRPIQADVPVGGAVETFTNFTVLAALPTLALTPASGGPGSTITVTGANYAATTSGIIYFDVNNNSAFDTGEPVVLVTTSGTGGIPAGTTINAPATLAQGVYPVRADIPFGGAIEASANFTVLARTITHAPTSGGPGTVVTVSGTGLVAVTGGMIFLDVDGNGAFTAGEPLVAVVTDTVGALSTTITIPTTLAAGVYNIMVDIPMGTPFEATLAFNVLAPTFAITPLQGVPGETITASGTGYTVGTAYRIYFDNNGNNTWDAAEPFILPTLTAVGALAAPLTLTVPNVVPGTYFVRIALNVAPFTPIVSAAFVRPAPILTLSPNIGPALTAVTVVGLGFNTAATTIYFDINGDSIWQAIEPFVAVAPALPLGGFTVTLTVPDVAPGTYFIRVDTTPAAAPADASIAFVIPAVPTITASVSPTSIVRGSTATLTWTTTGATTLSVFPGIGAVPLNGSLVVAPTLTTIYVFTATGPGGTFTSSVTLTVTDPPVAPAPTITATASPASIVRGATSTLTWTSTNATSVTLFPGVGAVPTSGAFVVSPTVTTPYIFTATGPGGSVNFTVTVTVTEPTVTPTPRSVEMTIGAFFYKVDGATRIMDAAPYTEDGRIMVPIRFFVEGLGGTVTWEDDTKTVIVAFTKPVLNIRFVIGEPVAVVGATIVPVDPNPAVVPVIVGGRAYAPLRFFTERVTGAALVWSVSTPNTFTVTLPR